MEFFQVLNSLIGMVKIETNYIKCKKRWKFTWNDETFQMTSSPATRAYRNKIIKISASSEAMSPKSGGKTELLPDELECIYYVSVSRVGLSYNESCLEDQLLIS